MDKTSAGGAVYKTDSLGIEHLHCSGIPIEDITVETPYKYVSTAFRKYRNRAPERTETGFQINGVNNARREFGRRWQLGVKIAF